jgi:hypothetical protein
VYKQLNCIYLIKPRWFSTDIVYKVLLLGDDMYFCRVGGQFYNIEEKQRDYNENMLQDIFMKDKKNFKKSRLTLNNVTINSRKSLWTGNLPNNGTVIFAQNNKNEKYIIPPEQSAKKAANFFKMIPGILVDFTEKKQTSKHEKLGAFNPRVYIKSSEYKRVSKITKYLNTFGWILGLWLMIYPEPYILAVILNIVLPIVGIYFYIRFNKFVEFDEKKQSNNPNVSTIIFMPSLALALRAIMDFNLFYKFQLWLYIIVITLIILVVILLNTEEYKTKKWLPIPIAIFIFSYVFGIIVLSNCLLDQSIPTRYTSYVREKHISRGKSTSYYLTVDPWGPVLTTEDVEVSQHLYENVEKQENLYLYLKKGFLGIEWFIPTEPES